MAVTFSDWYDNYYGENGWHKDSRLSLNTEWSTLEMDYHVPPEELFEIFDTICGAIRSEYGD